MPLLTAVICILLMRLPRPLEACLETAWTKGHLDPTTAMNSVSLSANRGSTCACCALCNMNQECASLSYNVRTRQCLLFNTVAQYSSIIAHSDWRYFVMPGRSRHLQFCREDSDCQDDGDSCRGRVCTELAAITCRVIYETFGAGERLGTHVQVYGWLNNTDLFLQCRMKSDWPGFTRVFRNQRDSTGITRSNIRRYNPHLAGGGSVHSSLDLAEVIRQLRNDETYELRTVAKCSDNSPYSDDHLTQSANITRSQSVLVEIATTTPVRDTFQEDFAEIPALSLPYLLHSEEDILDVKVNIHLEDGSQEQIGLPLARTDGLLWFRSVSLYIRE